MKQLGEKLAEGIGVHEEGQGGQMGLVLVTGKDDCHSLSEGLSSGAALVGKAPDSPPGDSMGT